MAVVTRRLVIRTSIRPDLTEGIIVDSAEIALQSSNTLTIASGFGDGYYPVVANFNWGVLLQSVVVDFEASARGSPRHEETGFGTGGVREFRDRMERVTEELAKASRFRDGPPCPSCGEPLRTMKSKQCFLCGYTFNGSTA